VGGDPIRAAIATGASALAECALAALATRYPHKLDHLILDATDQPLPQTIHPVFDGSYDWHSSVHMHWSLLRLARAAPGLPQAASIGAWFDRRVNAAAVATERRYAAAPGRGGFERPYGWAWLLKLQTELELLAALPASALPAGFAGCRAWAEALRPFSAEVAARLARFLRQSHYPVRAGTHANSAFAMLLGLDHAEAAGDHELRQTIDAVARAWFGADRRYPADYEPSGSDFLSAGLCEATLMRRVLCAEFPAWWSAFAPASLAPWLTPAVVSDRIDAQLVHLDGLNLSRAWCLATLAGALPAPDGEALRAAARRHFDAAWPHVTGGDFSATHWLVSFALLSLDAAA